MGFRNEFLLTNVKPGFYISTSISDLKNGKPR